MTSNEYQNLEVYPKSPLSPTKSEDVFCKSPIDFSKRQSSVSSDEVLIPTRTLTRNSSTSQATKEALKFVSSTSHLHEDAKELMEKMNAQHLSREQLQREVQSSLYCTNCTCVVWVFEYSLKKFSGDFNMTLTNAIVLNTYVGAFEVPSLFIPNLNRASVSVNK